MKPKACLFDLDGTLCIIDHRRWCLEKKPKDWKTFGELMPQDKPNFKVALVIKSFWEYGYQPIFVSGRMELYRLETQKWIQKWFPWMGDFPLLMRKNQDFRDDAIVKEEIYRTEIEPKYDVKLVLDDRAKVVRKWRELGLETWAVAQGEY
jgi:hypothetical protein